jgi:hypothetical protein
MLCEHFQDEMAPLLSAQFLKRHERAAFRREAILVQDVLLHPDTATCRQFLSAPNNNVERGDVPVRVLDCNVVMRRRIDDITFRMAAAWVAFYRRRMAIRLSRGGCQTSLLVCMQGTRLFKAETHALQYFMTERASILALRERPAAWMPIPPEEYAGIYMRNLGARLILLPAEGWLQSAIALSDAYVRHIISSMPPGTYIARSKAELMIQKLRLARPFGLDRPPPDPGQPLSSSAASPPAPGVSSTPSTASAGRTPRGFRNRGGGRFGRRGRGVFAGF